MDSGVSMIEMLCEECGADCEELWKFGSDKTTSWMCEDCAKDNGHEIKGYDYEHGGTLQQQKDGLDDS